jgi:muconolactone D-isomerase
MKRLLGAAGVGAGSTEEALGEREEDMMEFLVEFEVEVPSATPETEVEQRTRAEASAAARLVDEGHLLRLWRRNAVADDTTVIGLYDTDSEAQLDGLLHALPLADWMQVTVIPLAQHPNDPAPVAR